MPSPRAVLDELRRAIALIDAAEADFDREVQGLRRAFGALRASGEAILGAMTCAFELLPGNDEGASDGTQTQSGN